MDIFLKISTELDFLAKILKNLLKFARKDANIGP
jgi:hypothetical protein